MIEMLISFIISPVLSIDDDDDWLSLKQLLW